MAKGIIVGGGGGAGSDECTSTRAHVLAPYTAITKDSDDEPVSGTIPDFTGVKTKCENLWWNKDGDGNLAIAVPRGFHASDWGSGSYEYIAGQALRNAIGATDSARILAGTTIAGLAGTIQSLGGQTLTPSRSQQVISSSGKYMTGNVVLNPISGEYWNANEHQTFFNYGSYGPAAALGAYYARQEGTQDGNVWNTPTTPQQVTVNPNGGIVQSGIVSNRCFIFRGMISSNLKHIRVTVLGGAGGSQVQYWIINPATKGGYNAGWLNTVAGQVVTGSYDLSGTINRHAPNGWFLGIYTTNSLTGNNGGILKIELAPWAI